MAVYWIEVCGNETEYNALWNNNFTWNTNNPDFTWCFQGTVLTCVPLIYIILATIAVQVVSIVTANNGVLMPPVYSTLFKIKMVKFYIFLALTQPPVYNMISLFMVIVTESVRSISIKTICITISTLFLINICKCLYDVVNQGSHTLMLFANSSQLISFLVATFLMYAQNKRRCHTSGVQFTFWTLKLLIATISFRSTIVQLQKGEQNDLFLLITFYGYYFLLIVQWILVLIVDKSVFKPGKKSGKHQLTMSSLLTEETPLLGDVKYTQLEESDDENMGKHESKVKKCPEEPESFVSQLVYLWFYRILFTGYNKVLNFADVTDIQDRDKSITITKLFYKEWQKEQNKRQNRASNNSGPSLLSAITKSIGIGMVYSNCYRVATVFLMFAQPVLLRVLLNIIESDSEYTWHGYFIACCMLSASELNLVLIQKFLYHSYNFGTRLRTLVTAAVYRKSLRLSSASKRKTTVGEIVNLMSVDAQKLQDCPPYLCSVWSVPLTIVISTILIWQTVGVAALSGLAVIALIVPFNGLYVVNKVRILQAKQMMFKDRRIITINEVLTGMKVIKLYAWERFFEKKIKDQREKELYTIKWVNILNAMSAIAWNCSSYLVTLAVLGTYVFISKENVLGADKIFVTFSLINMLNFPMAILALSVGFTAQAYVSLGRIKKFLLLEEIDDNAVKLDPKSENPIAIQHGTFTWDEFEPPALTDIDLTVGKGELVAIVGQVGSGKSSLISALLGEMKKIRGKVTVSSSIAYVPQQAWIQLNSLKNNILFGKPENRHVYKKVIKNCALEHDLTILPDGDQTEIGDKGINLSGGQKQRVSLARAVYQNQDIYLLDDPLSAVDTHVGKHLFDKVIGPTGMLKHKTRILVTHSITYLPYVDKIYVLQNGRIWESGTYEELLKSDGAFAEFLNTYLEETDELEEQEKEAVEKAMSYTGEGSDCSRIRSNSRPYHLSKKDSNSSISGRKSLRSRKKMSVTESLHEDRKIEREQSTLTKKFINAEISAAGNVSLEAVKEYIGAAGWISLVLILFFHISCCCCMVCANIWLSFWSADKPVIVNGTAVQPDNTYQRLGVYGAVIICQIIAIQIGSLKIATSCYSASRLLHNNIVARLLRAPMQFFGVTPLGRIMNRCSKDIDYIDVNIPFIVRNWMFMMVPLFAILIVMTYSTPIILLAVIPISVIYIVCQRLYIKTTRQLKRIDSVARTPVFVHFDETIVGATSIRAYRKQLDFIQKCDQLTDESQRAWYLVTTSMRWLGVTMETLGNLVTFFASTFAVLQGSNSSIAGLSISYSLQISVSMNLFVRTSTELETYLVAVERVKEYSEVDTEADWDRPEETPHFAWPSRGKVEYKNYYTKYREDLDPVLHGISFVIRPSEKVGVVGRTGAGKSSLALSLFRLMEASGGQICIDDLDVSFLGLYDLRNRLTVIPQDPVIFSGTLRSNLDPTGICNDNELWDCLKMSHLKEFVSTSTAGLDYQCGEGGEALSVGQRQLLCLARALLRKNKVLVLDEATSGVDLETDDLLQVTIRTAFKDCTVITIAHRLNTVMDYDRIMVLDKGKIVEFDSPHKLMENVNSVFYKMAKDAKLC